MIRNCIWEELIKAKTNIVCIQLYVDSKRNRNRFFDFSIALLSGCGALLFNFNELIPVFTSVAIGILSVTKPLIPKVIQPESELAELDALHVFYTKYLNEIEFMWFQMENYIETEKQIAEKFHELKNSECDKEAILNKYIRHISKKFQSKINKQVTEYINRRYITSCQSQ